MIYDALTPDERLSQGHILDGCQLLTWESGANRPEEWYPESSTIRVVVLTQACDLAQGKSARVVVAPVHEAKRLVSDGVLKASTVRDHVRLHRVYGWYFLPAGQGIDESVVDLRDLHTLPRSMLEQQIREGRGVARIAMPYREHMAQHFSTTYARIALPMPYETE